MSFSRLAPEDFLVSSEAISSPLWTNGSPNLSTFFTSSTQSNGSSGNYYLNVFQSSNTASIQFAIAYGNNAGSGSTVYDYNVDGYSPTRSFLNTIQNLEELGIPTGPMPDGSPNEFLMAIKGMIDGNSKEIAENGKVAIGVGPLTITPAGITIPKDAYGKFI